MSIGVGLAVANNQRAMKAEAANGSQHEISSFTGKGASTLLNNGATPSDISLSDPGYSIKQVIIGWKHNKSNDGVTASVSVGGVSLGSGKVGGSDATSTTTIGDGNTSLSGAVNITWTNGMTGTGKGTLYVNTLTLVEGVAASPLESIAISGSLTKTSYTTAESWSNAGLIATGTYSDSSTKDLSSSVTWNYSPTTPSLMGAGTGKTLAITATLNEVTSPAYNQTVNVTKAIQFELVTDASKLTKGTTALIVGTGSYNSATYTKAMIATRKTSNGSFGSNANVTLSNGFNAGSVATSADATVFTLGGSAGAWTLSNGDNKLGFTGASNNNIQFNENMTDTFTIASNNKYVTIDSNTYSGRGLRMNVNNGSPLFSNYGSGNQQPVYLFANIAEVSYGTTDHIDVATLPQTHWHVGQTFTDSGIMINAWDNADEASGNSKVITEYTTSISDVTYGQPFTDSDIGPHTVTVTYTENAHDYTDTYEIYVYAAATYQLVTEEPAGGWAGNYLITATITGATEVDKVADGSYAMRSTGANLDYVGNYAAINPTTTAGVTTVVTGQEFQFSIAAVTGGYSIQGKDGKYIGWNSSSNNGMNSSDTPLVNTISNSGSDITILCSAGTKGLKLDKSSGQFRYYSNPGIKLYKLVESSAASAYADEFLNLLSTGTNPVCKYNESTHVVTTDLEELQLAWALLYIDFNDLSNADKQVFTQGTADSSGDEIAKALALYDHIVKAYGVSLESDDCDNYNFMNRAISSPLGHINVTNNTNTVLIVMIVSILSMSAVGGVLLILRKRKHN